MHQQARLTAPPDEQEHRRQLHNLPSKPSFMKRLMYLLASLKLTAVLLALMAVVLVLLAAESTHARVLRDLLVVLLAINLVANLFKRRRAFLRKPVLLLFHLGLAAFIVLAGLGQLSRYTYHQPVAVGQRITIDADQAETGPLRPGSLDPLTVALFELDVGYTGNTFASGRAHVGVEFANGKRFQGHTQPNEPAGFGGLRIYLTPTQGYAAVFRYAPRQESRPPTSGLVYFPDHRKDGDRQIQDMSVPGLDELLNLSLTLPTTPKDGPWTLTAPEQASVLVNAASMDFSGRLAPGAAMAVPGGELSLESLVPYAGLTLIYNPFESWVIGLCFVLGLALCWYYLAPRTMWGKGS